jgi:hypothetical protein
LREQAIPIPFPIGGAELSNPLWSPELDTLSESFITLRRYPSFRAYHDSGSFNSSEITYESRLVGRSVWNTEWWLVIPGGTLHSDRWEGLMRFVYGQKVDATATGAIEVNYVDETGATVTEHRDGKGVQDILLFFQTYAYSGS